MQMYRLSDMNFIEIFHDFIHDVQFVFILVVYVYLGDDGPFTCIKEQKILADLDMNMPF